MNEPAISYDLVIPVGGKDCLFLRRNLSILEINLQPVTIYIITKKIYFIYFTNTGRNVRMIDEDSLMPGINFNKIATYLSKVGLDSKFAGWYLQQFLKMGFALSKYAKKKFYLTWDADTVPLKGIAFFDEDITPFFTMKDEYHKPYFDTMKKLLKINKIVEGSFISENMIFEVGLMKEMISKIQITDINGKTWCEKIINSISNNEINGFSEFETYGSYVLNYYPKKYKLRKLASFRECGKQYSRALIKMHLSKLSKENTIITFENKDRPQGVEGILDWIEKGIVFVFNKALHVAYRV